MYTDGHIHIYIYTVEYYSALKKMKSGNSLAVQWLGQCALTAADPSSIPGQRTKIPQAAGHSQITDEIFSCVTPWMGLEGILHSEISQTERQMLYDFTHNCNF